MGCEIFTPASGADSIGRQIKQIGSAVVREAWPVQPLGVLQKAISDFCENRRADVAAGKFSHATAKMYASHGVGTLAGLVHEGYLSGGAMKLLFSGSRYEDICRAYFGSDRLYFQLNRCGFREHRTQLTRKSFIPYHQDSYSQDDRVKDVLNCWTPLSRCGRDAPGLEVVLDRCTPNFRRKDFGLATENAAYDFITIAREDVVAAFGDNFLHEEFEVGDCLIFSQDVIHRTYVTPEMTRDRINFEFRVFAEHCMAADDREEMIRTHQAIPLFNLVPA